MWIFFKLTLICILLYNEIKEKVIIGIGYSYLVLCTRSAAKFEQVPSTNLNPVTLSHNHNHITRFAERVIVIQGALFLRICC